MSERMLLNRIRKIKELQQQIDELEAELEEAKKQVQSHMEHGGVEELNAGGFTVRWKVIFTTRFDSRSFKMEHEDLYKQYMKQSQSRRFTIS